MKFRNFFTFRLSTIFIVGLVVTGVVWWFVVGQELYRDYQDRQALKNTDPYELEQAQVAAGNKELPGLVTILGDSRFKHWSLIYTIDLLSDGRYISHGRDGAARIWNRDGTVNKVFDAKQVVVNSSGKHYGIFFNGLFQIYDSANDKVVADLKMGDSESLSSRFAIDDIARHCAYADKDSVQVYDLVDRRTVIEIPFEQIEQQLGREKLFDTNSKNVALSTDGSRLAFSASYATAVFDVKTKELLFHKFVQDSPRESALIYSIKLVDGGKTYLFSDAVGRLWIADIDRNEVFHVKSDDIFSAFRCFDVVADGKEIWSMGDKDSFQVDIEKRNLKSLGFSGKGNSNPGALLVDQDRWLYANRTHTINRINAVTGKHESSDPDWDIRCVRFSINGEQLVAGCSDGAVRFFRVGTWELVRTIDCKLDEVDSLMFSDDERYLAVCSDSNRKLNILNTKDGSLVNEIETLGSVESAFAFGPDETLVYFSAMQQVEVYDIRGGKLLRPIDIKNAPKIPAPNGDGEFHPSLGKTPQFSSDRKWLFTSNNFHSITVWDFETRRWKGYIGRQNANWGMRDHMFFISPDEQLVATISAAGPVRIYNMPDVSKGNIFAQTGSPLFELKAHAGSNARVAFTHDKKMILTTGTEGWIKFWDRENGRLLHTIQYGPEGSCIFHIHVSKDDRYFATANGNGTAYIFRMPNYFDLKAKQPKE